MTAPPDPAGAAAPRASVSLSGGSGASAAECNTPTVISNPAPCAGKYPSPINAAANRAKRQEDFSSIQTIRQPGYCLSSHQPHHHTSGQRQRDRLRRQVVIVQQNWQVRRLDAEPRIERAVEDKKPV